MNVKPLIVVLLLACGAAQAGEVRSKAELRKFARTHMCPSTHRYHYPCPGYVVDHKKPLDCGGRDIAENMQYQTVEEGKAKDRCERNGPTCKHRTHGPMVPSCEGIQ